VRIQFDTVTVAQVVMEVRRGCFSPPTHKRIPLTAPKTTGLIVTTFS
jgi:hypothetical protein